MNVKQLSKPTPGVKRAKAPTESGDSIWNKEINIGGNKISDKEKFTLYHQLYNLIDAGIDIRNAFEVLENQIKSKKTREKIAKIRNDVVNGKTLSDLWLSFLIIGKIMQNIFYNTALLQ